MSVRPHDWAPLAGADPIPGDPEAVRSAALRYSDVAGRIRSAARNLLRVAAAADGTSEAMSAFRDRIGTVHAELSRVETRYDGLANALATYAPRLSEAQAVSLAALASAREAQNRAWSAEHARRTAEEQARYTVDPAQQDALTTQLILADRSAEDAATALAAARAQLNESIASRDEAAATATAAIEDTQAASTVNDTRWDVVVDAVGDAAVGVGEWLDAVGEVLDKFSTVLAVLHVVLIVASFFIPALGAVVLLAKIVKVVAFTAKAVTLVREVARTVRIVTGREKFTWRDAVAEGAAFGAGLVLGKAAGAVSKGLTDRVVKHAQGTLALSQQMRFVQAGLKAPEARAAIWAEQVFPRDTTEELVELAGTSTEYGRRAISTALAQEWVVEHGFDLVGDVAEELVEVGADALVDAMAGSSSTSSDAHVPAGDGRSSGS